MGFTPFELLFDCRPRGLVNVAKEAWEEQPSPFRSVVKYVQNLQQKIDRVLPIVRENMERAQAEQKRTYERPESFNQVTSYFYYSPALPASS